MRATPEFDDDEGENAEPALLTDLGRLTGSACPDCGKPICGHEVLFSVAMGAKDVPRCLGCLAAALGRSGGELRDDLAEHFRHRRCYWRAWGVACEREGQALSTRPACLGDAGPTVREGAAPTAGAVAPSLTVGPRIDTWDAGDMACGDLVLALRIRMNALPPGSVLEVTARDPAAPLDLPAWCRLTGHRLVAAAPPSYRIQRKET